MKIAFLFVSLLLPAPALFAQQDAAVVAAKTSATAQEAAIALAQTQVHVAEDAALAYFEKNGTQIPPTAGGLSDLELAQLNLLNVALRFSPADSAAIAAKSDWLADAENHHPGFQVVETPTPHLWLKPSNWS